MSLNGILASMCFPTFTGFSAPHLSHFKDDTTVVMIQAYNDWHIDEWGAAYPGPVHPAGPHPHVGSSARRWPRSTGWRPRAAAAITMPELPHVEGLPSYHDIGLLGAGVRGLSDAGLVMCLPHRAGLRRHQEPARRTDRQPDHPRLPGVGDRRAGPAVGPGHARLPRPEDRVRRRGASGGSPSTSTAATVTTRTRSGCVMTSAGSCRARSSKSTRLACYVTDPSALRLRDHIGIDNIAWECDYPHSDSIWPDAPEQVLDELDGGGCQRRGDQQDHVGERRPASSTGIRSRRSRGAGHRGGAAGRRRATSTRRSAPGRSGRRSTRSATPADAWFR